MGTMDTNAMYFRWTVVAPGQQEIVKKGVATTLLEAYTEAGKWLLAFEQIEPIHRDKMAWTATLLIERHHWDDLSSMERRRLQGE